LHHFGNGNTRGAKKLYFTCNKYLQEYPDFFEGIDVAKLRSELEACCAELLASDEEYPELEIDPELLPEIHLKSTPGS
jgi:predicted metal-dependent hydrolase